MNMTKLDICTWKAMCVDSLEHIWNIFKIFYEYRKTFLVHYQELIVNVGAQQLKHSQICKDILE